MGIGDKAKAAADQAVGKIKQGVGDLTDNERLEAEGAAQELKGKAEAKAEQVTDSAQDKLDQLKNRLA